MLGSVILKTAASADPRAEAARTVAAVLAGRSLDEAIAQSLSRGGTPQNQSLTKAMAYGVVREHRLLSNLLSRLLERPLKNEPEINALMLVGLYQLRSMRVAPHAAVSETVSAASALGKPKLHALINAVLRRYQREREALENLLPATPEVQLSYPDWLAQHITADWGERANDVLAAGNQQGPLTLRVNRSRLSLDAYLRRLDVAGLEAQRIDGVADALMLESAVGVEDIPGFAAGDVSVQDASAQLAADLLDAQGDLRVLDACAAPGGKTAHLLERAPGLYVMSTDIDPLRLRRIEDTLARLGLKARVLVGDAEKPLYWWDGNPFDRILLDAPCSGTGVIRRHPDIKWLRRDTDIAKLAATQKGMLHALWPLLEPGGTLVYATCSILKAEGEDVIKHFLITHADAKHVPIDASWGEPCTVGRRIAPGGAFDGFYYARLIKR